MNSNTATATVTILATSHRGAHLVTNGTKAAWVMGRQVREDGTLTAGARESIELSDMTHDAAVQLAAAISGNREAQEQIRKERYEAARTEANAEVTINVTADRFRGEHGNAWQIRTDNTYRNRYGKTCFAYEYLPKSRVTVVPQPDGSYNITLANWLLREKPSMVYTKVA